MTQTRDLIKKMADFFKSEEYYEKGEDARLEFSPDDVRCVNGLIKRISNLDKIRAEIEQRPYGVVYGSVIQGMKCERVENLKIIDKYKAESEDKE